nr:ribonuclease H-like domain-containing protein [Tanacetum cinerariifolium]
MRMKQYLTHTDYALWEVIVNGDAPASIASVSGGVEVAIPPKITKQNIAMRNELKAKSTMLLAIPDEHLLKFHGIKDAKTLWEAIKTRFGGNKESKKMQKTILKQQYENFAASRSEEDANLKLLRSLPPAWNTYTLIMQNKSDLDTLSMDDLYNNLKLDNEDLEQIDTYDLEEIDLKWQVAVLTMRVKRFIKKTGRNLNFNGKETVGFDKTKVECYSCHRKCHFARECRAPRSQGNKNGDNMRRVVPVKTHANALVRLLQLNTAGSSFYYWLKKVLLVIVNGDAPASIASISGGVEVAIPPKITKQNIAIRNELKAKRTMLSAILDEHLLKFHGIKDAKTLWEAIKTRVGGNKESKKMQKTILKQQYENFAASRSEVAVLTMRVKRFIKKTGRNLNFNGKETVGFDKTKVECYSCHRKGHFARECGAPRSQGNKNGDNTRRVVPVETHANALVVTNRMGYDWSYQAEEGPTDFALMAFSSSNSSSSDTEVRDNSITELKNQLEESLKKKMI